jgi:hypothetical protein
MHRVVTCLFQRGCTLCFLRRVLELHDGRRERARNTRLRTELRPPAGDQATLRSGKTSSISTRIFAFPNKGVEAWLGNRSLKLRPSRSEQAADWRTWEPHLQISCVAQAAVKPLERQEELNIERCGFHAFRHGNATVMDQEHVPMVTRQNRLGQSHPRTTMGYTHAYRKMDGALQRAAESC